MPNPKRLEQTALVGLLVQLVFVVVSAFMGSRSNSLAVKAETAHMGVGVLVWLLVFFHGRARRRAEEEKDERERLKTARLSDEIFEDMELDTVSAGTMLRIFEKWVVPIASVLLSVALIGLAVWVLQDKLGFGDEGAAEAVEIGSPALVAVIMVFIAFGGFLFGRYAAGLAQSRTYRLLRAAGGYLMGNVLGALLICAAMVLSFLGKPGMEAVVSWAVPALMAIVGVEILLNLVLDIYRPRVSGQERRPPYDSRLLGLFAEPGSVLETVAATLDYQFGFKVSETWFYRFMEKAILPLLVVQFGALWLMSCLVVVAPQEAVFIERFGVPRGRATNDAGQPTATVYDSGYYLKLPWPFETVRRADAHAIRKIPLGQVTEDGHGGAELVTIQSDLDRTTRFWSRPHVDYRKGEREELYLIPGGRVDAAEGAPESGPAPGAAGASSAPEVNLARMELKMLYRVRHDEDGSVDPAALYQYLYGRAEVDEQVKWIAQRALWHVAASQDFTDWMTVGRRRVCLAIENAVMKAIEKENLGVNVAFVGVETIQPPLETSEAYEKVITAQQQYETLIWQGKADKARTEALADVRSAEIISEAEQEKLSIELSAKGDADLFTVQREVASAETPLGKVLPVYLFRLYCEAMEDALPGHKIYVVPPTAHEVNVIDLESRATGGMMDVISGN